MIIGYLDPWGKRQKHKTCKAPLKTKAKSSKPCMYKVPGGPKAPCTFIVDT